MNNNEIKELIWGYELFQRCVPNKYRTDVSFLIGKYYSTHPTDEMIKKIGTMMVNLINDTKKEKLEEINFVKYIKEHYND